MAALELDLNDPLGADLLLGDDLDPAHRMISGIALLVRDLWHRITTPRGMLVDDEDYGIDVRSYLHAAMTRAEVANAQSQIAAELARDPRVEAGSIRVQMQQADLYSWTISIQGLATTGPFELVGAVSEVAARLVSVNGDAVNDAAAEAA